MDLNSAQQFADARPIAQHCSELLARTPRPEERQEEVAAWRRDFAHSLSAEFANLLAGEDLEVTPSEPEAIKGKEIFERIGPVAANCLLRCGHDERTVLLSIDLKTAIALTDRSFGGTGTVDADIPEHLPRSAELLVEQIAMLVANAGIKAGAGDEPDQAGDNAGAVEIVRGDNAIRLKPFDANCDCAFVTLKITVKESGSWDVFLALPTEQFNTLMPGVSGSRPARPQPPDIAAASSPFAQVPLGVEAVLAEFDMSLERLESLAPGEQIPLALARDVPLRIGAEAIAHGSLGTFEDHLAVRLTRIASQGSPS